jgi:hypothetical protein
MKHFRLLPVTLLIFLLSSHLYSQDVNAKRDSSRFIEYGITGGTPSTVNIDFGGWIDCFGLRVSGMYFGTAVNGVQLNYGYRFWYNSERYHSLSLVTAYHHNGIIAEAIDYGLYVGLVYNYRYKNFFLETGPVLGRKNGKNLSHGVWAFQIGWIK